MAEPLLTSREITKKRHLCDNSDPIAAQDTCCAACQATEFLPCRGEVTLNPEPGFPLRTVTFSFLVMRWLSSVRVRCSFALLLCIAIPHAGAAQTLTTLQSFNGRDGSKSFAGLVQGTNGELYGTTYFGGSKNSGEVFEVTSGGTLATGFFLTRGVFAPKISYTDGELQLLRDTGPGHRWNLLWDNILWRSQREWHGSFKISPTGTLTTRHSFGGTDGRPAVSGG